MAPATEIQKLREMFTASIRALAEALEAKDPYSKDHSRRVADISQEITTALGLSDRETAQIRLAALLHDVGKIGVRESVLNKAGKLSAEEYDHIMQHCAIGKRILEPIFRGSAVLDMVMHHHERYDGTGRPGGLAGSAIPLGARVVALADAVDAMASARPYRPQMPAAQIISEVRGNRGVQFDPAVVDAFLATRRGGEFLRNAKEQAVTVKCEPTATAPEEAQTEPAGQNACDVSTPSEPADVEQGTRTTIAEHTSTIPAVPPPHPLIGRKEMEGMLSKYQDLRALPFITAEILQLTARSDSDIEAITQTILCDPALVARILRLANTTYYSSKGRVQTVERAVVNIGYTGIRDVAMGVAVQNLFPPRGDTCGVNRFSLWKHNLACAVICRAFANQGRMIPVDVAFVAGLLHDLGIAAIDDMFPAHYAPCVTYASEHGVPLIEAERLFIGADHTSIGPQMCTAWGIAEKFKLPMALHHEPWRKVIDIRTEEGPIVCAVKVADLLARARGDGDDWDPVLDDIPDAPLARLNLDRRKIETILADLPRELMELQAVFLMHEPTVDLAGVKRDPVTRLAGLKALLVDPLESQIDVIGVFLSGRNVSVTPSTGVSSEALAEKPDIVALRVPDEITLARNLRQMQEWARAEKASPARVLVLGLPPNEAVLSAYPAAMRAVVDRPYSIPAMERGLTGLFEN